MLLAALCVGVLFARDGASSAPQDPAPQVETNEVESESDPQDR